LAYVIAERHVAGDSFVHGLDARSKLLTTLVFIFAALFTPAARWDLFAAMGALLALVTLAAGLSPRLIIGRSMLALPFVLAATPVLFNREGQTLFEVPLFGWRATDGGVEALLSIMLRSWLSVLAATILTATTEPDRILRALRWLGVPRLLVATISFMWRYIFVIAEETQRMLRAREARSARPGGQTGGSIAWRARVAGNMVGTLFLRSLSRGERVYVAMLARGYNGELRSLDRSVLRSRDIGFLLAAIALVAAIQIYARI
jgi:cobalt/nickel transport system permease protein